MQLLPKFKVDNDISPLSPSYICMHTLSREQVISNTRLPGFHPLFTSHQGQMQQTMGDHRKHWEHTPQSNSLPLQPKEAVSRLKWFPWFLPQGESAQQARAVYTRGIPYQPHRRVEPCNNCKNEFHILPAGSESIISSSFCTCADVQITECMTFEPSKVTWVQAYHNR